MPSQLAAARRKARNRRLGLDPDVPRGGGLAARQRRDEIVDHLFGIGLAMQVSARQTMSSRPPRQLSRQKSPQVPPPVVEPSQGPVITPPSRPVQDIDGARDHDHRARLHVVRDGEVAPPDGDVPLYAALSEIFAQDSARRTAADLAGTRRRRPHRRPGRRSVLRHRVSAVPLGLGGAGATQADTPVPAVGSTREVRLVGALVTLADSPVTGHDLTQLMAYLVDACVDVLGVSGAGVMLADGHLEPALVASSGPRAESLDAVQLRARRGPCWDCIMTGAAQSVSDITAQARRWPQFAPLAAEQGFRLVLAVPLRIRLDVVGSLSLYRTTRGEWAQDENRMAQALAAVATVGVLQQRPPDPSIVVKDGVEHASSDRVQLDRELPAVR
ncbi:MAG TPA: GAF domain-containing protein [Nakamurella sp.]